MPGSFVIDVKHDTIFLNSYDQQKNMQFFAAINGTNLAQLDRFAFPKDTLFGDTMAYDAVDNRIFFMTAKDKIATLDLRTKAIENKISLPYGEYEILGNDMAYNPTSKILYIASNNFDEYNNGFGNDKYRHALSMLAIDTQTWQVVMDRKLIESRNQWSSHYPVALDLKENRLYTSCVYCNGILVLNATSLDQLATIETPGPPFDIAIDEGKNLIYAVSDKTLSKIDGTTMNVEKSIRLPSTSLRLAVNPTSNIVYATSLENPPAVMDGIMVIDGVDGAVLSKVPVDYPVDVKVNPETGLVYIASRNEAAIFRISENDAVHSVAPRNSSDFLTVTSNFLPVKIASGMAVALGSFASLRGTMGSKEKLSSLWKLPYLALVVVAILILALIGASFASVSYERSLPEPGSPKPADQYLYQDSSSGLRGLVIFFLLPILILMIIATAGSIMILRRRPRGIYVAFLSFLPIVLAFNFASYNTAFAIITVIGFAILYIGGIGSLRMALRGRSGISNHA